MSESTASTATPKADRRPGTRVNAAAGIARNAPPEARPAFLAILDGKRGVAEIEKEIQLEEQRHTAAMQPLRAARDFAREVGPLDEVNRAMVKAAVAALPKSE